MDNLKHIMVGKLKNDGFRKLEPLRFQKRKILQDNVKGFQENRLEES